MAPARQDEHSGFLNLSNHPIALWDDPQRAAARALGHGAPFELPGGMPLVPPEAGAGDIARLADALLARLAALPRGAHVAGEPTLSVALVDRLRHAGVACYAATTARDVRETTRPDGALERTHLFRFVRWRRYPANDWAAVPAGAPAAPSAKTGSGS